MSAGPTSQPLYVLAEPMPAELASGLCAAPGADPDLWASTRPSDRQRAKAVCGRCPVLGACRSWALAALPDSDSATYAAMTAPERRRQRQARLAEAARASENARREAARRASERRRRILGKAPTTRERYAADPEPFKAQARAYYQAHREEIIARRREQRSRARAS